MIGLSIAMPATLIDAWLNRPPVLDPATLPILLDEVEDETEVRLLDTGLLFTSLFAPADEDEEEGEPDGDAARTTEALPETDERS